MSKEFHPAHVNIKTPGTAKFEEVLHNFLSLFTLSGSDHFGKNRTVKKQLREVGHWPFPVV